jgi:UDPglucose 6-dehydrogenase
MDRIAVIGLGKVGKCVAALFPEERVVRHDPPRGITASAEQLQACAFAFVCVPTPPGPDGACDPQLVAEVIGSLPNGVPIVIKSTVPPGFTDAMRERYADGPIVFSPEYVGEGGYYVAPPFPDPHSMVSHGFLVLGGATADCGRVADLLLPIMGPTTRVRIMPALEAELVKYFENAWLAFKVAFVNEQRAICEGFGASYHLVREGWLDDPRVGLSHSAAFASSRGFSGKCLPKDLAALRAAAAGGGIATPLLDAVAEANRARLDLATRGGERKAPPLPTPPGDRWIHPA